MEKINLNEFLLNIIKNKRLKKLIFENKIIVMQDIENYLDNIYKKSKDEKLSGEKVRGRVIELVKKASIVTNFSVPDLLSRLDLKLSDQTIEALESFLAELRSIFWLNDFGFTEILPLQAGKSIQSDFTARFNEKMCAIEVFCLTQKHEQQKDLTLNVYVNFDPNFTSSKFGRDFMSKAQKKKKQLDANITAQMKILLCVLNSQPVIRLNTAEEMDYHAKFLYENLKWGKGYYVGILTGVEVNGKSSNTIYPKLV